MKGSPRIIGKEKVTAVFGGWPAFHDAEVYSIACERVGSKVTVHLTLEAAVARVVLSFHDCADVRLEDFRPQNVMFSLEITETGDGIKVGFDASIGLEGGFTCREVQVLEVRAKATSSPIS